jgi:hypothetical protein
MTTEFHREMSSPDSTCSADHASFDLLKSWRQNICHQAVLYQRFAHTDHA